MQPSQLDNKKKRSSPGDGNGTGVTRRQKSTSPFEQTRPQHLELDERSKPRQASTKRRSSKKSQVSMRQQDARVPSGGGSGKESKKMEMQLRSTSELVIDSNNDCLTSENCIWRKRFMDLVRENERNKQRQKSNLTSQDYTIQGLNKQIIELSAEKSALEDRVRHYEIALQNKVTDLQGRSTQAGSRFQGTASAMSSPAGGGIFNAAIGQQINQRQSEMVNTKNTPLSSEIGWPAGRKPEKQTFSHAFISNTSSRHHQATSEDTASVMIPILISNEKSHETSGFSPNTLQPDSSLGGGTPHVIILEEKQKESDDKSSESDQNYSKFKPRAADSDFSLTNMVFEDTKSYDDVVIGLKQDSANLSNDDIIVDDGKSTEGLGERNNPFAMHQFTHRVDNEETPSQPVNNRPLASSQDGQIIPSPGDLQFSQTMQNRADENIFKDVLLMETPSFVDVGSERDTVIELNRNHNHNRDDLTPTIQPSNHNSSSFDSDLNSVVPQQKASQEKKFMSPANSISSPSILIRSSTKKVGLQGNAWEQAMAMGKAPLPRDQQQEQMYSYERSLVSQSAQFAPQKIFSNLKPHSSETSQVAQSINLVQSQPSELNQPHERVDSDEIELQDSEDGCDETDNCDFGSIEAKANVLLASESRQPQNQPMFNEQMTRLNHQNLSRILQIQHKSHIQVMQRITEEPLQTTSEFSTTFDKETNRLSSRQTLALQHQLNSQNSSDQVDSQPNLLRCDGADPNQPRGRASSSVLIIDDDEKDEDEDSEELFERDESCMNDDEICLDAQSSIGPRQQPSIIVMSEGRPSDLFEDQQILGNFPNFGFEPLEATNETHDSLFEPSKQQESGLHYNQQPRFSTIMSDRDSSNILGRYQGSQAFFLQPSFSQIGPPESNANQITLVGPPEQEIRPSTNVVQNQLPAMNMSCSIPYGCELNLTDAAIENVGEESKEPVLSKAGRLHGQSFMRRGQSGCSRGEFDASAQGSDTGQVLPGEFVSRQTIADTSGMPMQMHLLSAGNEQLKKPVPHDSIGLSMLDEDSVSTPHAVKQNEDEDEILSPELKSSTMASNFFHQVVVSEKSTIDRYMDKSDDQRRNDSFGYNNDLSQEPEFFMNLQIDAQRSKNSRKPPRIKKGDAMTMEDLESQEIVKGKATMPNQKMVNETALKLPVQPTQVEQSLLFNRSAKTKMTSSILIDNNRRKFSDVLLMPRSSVLRGKQSVVAMHASIVNSNKFNMNQLLNVSTGPFDKTNRHSRGMMNDSTLKMRSNFRNYSLAGKSQDPSLLNAQNNIDDELKHSGSNLSTTEYEQGGTRSLEETEKMRQKTVNTRQKHMHTKQYSQKDQNLQQQLIDSANQATIAKQQAQLLAMTAESSDLKSCLAEEHKMCKKEQTNLKIPMNQSVFMPPSQLKASIVSMSSPVAEEESNVSFDHRARFQQSPKPFHGKTDFAGGMLRNPHVGKSIPNMMSKMKQFGRNVSETVENIWMSANQLKDFARKPPAENLLWFAHLLELRTIQSDFFFEKYMVVGLADEQLAENIATKGDFIQRARALKPKVLFSTPSMTRSSSNFNETKYLIDDETVEIIADFCFPNGVQILKMADFKPGLPAEQQSEEMQGYINQVVHELNNVRGDMFCFTIDASETIEVNEGEILYGDCHLIALVHTFMNFKEFDGQLYLVKNALCIVTTAPSNFGLIAELLDRNMLMMRHQRMNLIAQPELMGGSNEYPPEIQACLQQKFEQPPDELISLLELVRTYKVNNLAEAIDAEGQLFCQVKIDDFNFEYTFPRGSKQTLAEGMTRLALKDMQLDLIPHHWHMSIFFSLFGPETFYKVLTAVLLERSIVFVHANAMVVSNVIFALKHLLHPFMWCSSLIPVLPRPLFDYLLQPLPVLVGISQNDYERALRETHDSERREKTWIFLDAEVAQFLGENPEHFPFATNDQHDIDSRSGIRIVWGQMENEFSEPWRSNMLLAWLDEMQTEARQYFDLFERLAHSEEQGTEALPTVLSSFDKHFEYVTGADDDDGEHNLDSRPSLGQQMAKSNRKKQSQSQEFSLQKGFRNGSTLRVRKLDTAEDEVMQRDSNLSENERAFNIGAVFYDQPITEESEVHRSNNEAIIEQTDNTDADSPYDHHQENDYMPIVIVPNEKLKKAIEFICLELARTYREKIIMKVPELCQECGITQAEMVFDSEKLSESIGELVPPDLQGDRMFLEQFAYTQMFSFLLENYIAAINIRQKESEMGDACGDPSRQSDYMLNKFTSNLDNDASIDQSSWSRHTMSSQLDTLQSAQRGNRRDHDLGQQYQTEKQQSRKNTKQFNQTSQSSLKECLENSKPPRATSKTARNEH